jgi:hypothetical protein
MKTFIFYIVFCEAIAFLVHKQAVMLGAPSIGSQSVMSIGFGLGLFAWIFLDKGHCPKAWKQNGRNLDTAWWDGYKEQAHAQAVAAGVAHEQKSLIQRITGTASQSQPTTGELTQQAAGRLEPVKVPRLTEAQKQALYEKIWQEETAAQQHQQAANNWSAQQTMQGHRQWNGDRFAEKVASRYEQQLAAAEKRLEAEGEAFARELVEQLETHGPKGARAARQGRRG